ncbi:MAG: glycosyltransferase family 4 protein [Bacteroidales bacterium]|nr:glycosyltransferase family 4 protein [Lachnoclostridium sp.]MCM1384725.1 glycosyltransferase family 4 protein [Lachnoclostridium sp.]MCM1465261.1 glycosyltransferase family 4 protein [Bacteroidales bacterium]
MKIAFLTGDLSDGGAQRVLSVIANGLAQKGNDVLVIVFAQAEKEYSLCEKIERITLYPSYEEYASVSLLKRLSIMRKVLKRFEPDAAVGFMEAGYALFISSIGLPFKKIGSLRISPYYQEANKSLRGRLERYWFRKASAVVLQTESQKEYAVCHKWANPTVIPNPINSSVFDIGEHSYRDSCSKLIMVGRLHEQKNYPLALHAVQRAVEVIPHLRLEIYGDGEERNELVELTVKLGLQNNVSFMGWHSDIVARYKESDLFLMTSHFEGLPNALMEAMGCGLPCISTDCPTGPADLIKNGVTGMLVPITDVDALTNAIIKICNMSGKERGDMGRRAKEYIRQNYNVECITEKWEALFCQLEKRR